MKKLLLISALLLLSSAGYAQCNNTSYLNGWTCVKKAASWTGTSALSITASFASNVISGHGVFVFVSACYDNSCEGTSGNINGMSISVANSGLNTVVPSPSTPTRAFDGGTHRFLMGAYWFPNSSALTDFTVNCSGGSGPSGACFYLTLYASEWIGGSTSTSTPFDIDSGANNAAGASTATPSISLSGTTTNANNLILGWINGFNGSAYTPGSSPLTFLEVQEDLAGEEVEGVSVTSTGSYSCNWTTTAQLYNGMCVALKSGGAAPSNTRKRAMVVQR